MIQVIALRTDPQGQPVVTERLAGGVITPGHLVVETSTGTVIANATIDALAQKLFALPNLCVAGDIDTDYASGELARYGAFHAGQEVNALVAAAGAAIAQGAPVTSNGAGGVKIGTVANAIGFALEAVDNSGGGTAVRIKIRVA